MTHDKDALLASTGCAGAISTTLVNECLADLYDNSKTLEKNEEGETTAAVAEASTGGTLNKDGSSLPTMHMFLNAFLDFQNISIVHRNAQIAAGNRECGHVGTEIHYQQLNLWLWFGMAYSGTMAETPQLDSSRRQNVPFQSSSNK